eukprot:763095-Hanusia_phi.AAC.2
MYGPARRAKRPARAASDHRAAPGPARPAAAPGGLRPSDSVSGCPPGHWPTGPSGSEPERNLPYRTVRHGHGWQWVAAAAT